MPTYQYQCRQCGHRLEELQSMTEPPLTHCPSCNTENLARIIGSGAGLIFKGSGFYLTDYRKDPGKKEEKEKKEEKKPESPASSPDTKESKPSTESGEKKSEKTEKKEKP